MLVGQRKKSQKYFDLSTFNYNLYDSNPCSSLGVMNFQKWELFSGSPGIKEENSRNERRDRIMERYEQERQELKLPYLFIDMQVREENSPGLNKLIKQAQATQFSFAAGKQLEKQRNIF